MHSETVLNEGRINPADINDKAIFRKSCGTSRESVEHVCGRTTENESVIEEHLTGMKKESCKPTKNKKWQIVLYIRSQQ